MAEINTEEERSEPDELLTTEVAGNLEVRDISQRELGVFIVPWDTTVSTPMGLEEFRRGAFAHIDPKKVRLRMDHQNPVAGRGISLEERDTGAYMAFKVSQTAKGDEILTLAADGSVDGASVGFAEVPGGTSIETRNGRRVRVHRKVDLREVSTTWQPAYEQAAVMYVRSEDAIEVAPMSETEVAPVGATPETADNHAALGVVEAAMNRMGGSIEQFSEKFADRLEKLEERNRSQFTIPGVEPEKPAISRAEWVSLALRTLSGDRVPAMEMRAAEDVISSDNAGIVPDAFSSELIGVIDPSRPFLASTRRLPTPVSGMSLVVPVITQRPIVEQQMTEKATLATQTTKIGTKSFDMVTKGGYGDISLQLLKRADRSFLDLYLQLLAEAYGTEAEVEAVRALLDEVGGVGGGGPLDPNDLSLGSAYTTSFDAIRRPPDTIWLSTEAVGAFIDAKASGTNAPLYPGLSASATAAGGISGVISGLRPVHVPVLDAHGAFAIVGPSSGFAWAEDGTYTLQVDVPAKAGRDVALVGMLWFAPWYPAAFTVYNVAS